MSIQPRDWTQPKCCPEYTRLRQDPLFLFILTPSSSLSSSTSGFHQLEPRCTSAAALFHKAQASHNLSRAWLLGPRNWQLNLAGSMNLRTLERPQPENLAHCQKWMCYICLADAMIRCDYVVCQTSLTPVWMAVSIQACGVSVCSPAKCSRPSGRDSFSWYSLVWNMIQKLLSFKYFFHLD